MPPAPSGQFPGIIPAVSSAVGSAVSGGIKAATPIIRGVGQDVSSLLFGGDFVNPFGSLPSPSQRMTNGLFAAPPAVPVVPPMTVTGQRAVPLTPEQLSKLRLLKSLQDQSALQNQVAPISGAGATWGGGAGTTW